MTPAELKQLRNTIALSRHGIIAASQDQKVSEEALAELTADVAGMKRYLARQEAVAQAAEAEAIAAAKLQADAAKAGQ